MDTRIVPLAALLTAVLVLAAAPAAEGQPSARRSWAANVVVPQARSFRPVAGPAVVHVGKVEASIDILEQVATTTLVITLQNRSGSPQQTELLVPVPAGVTVRAFDIGGGNDEIGGRLLPAAEARKLYADIVAKLRDPGLLQFAGHDMLRSNVFPVPARGAQRIRIVYEQLLPADGVRVDYVLPRTDSLGYAVPWTIRATIRTKNPVAAVYSPSHPLKMTRSASGVLTATVTRAGQREPGAFRLSYLKASDGLSASLFAYPDPAMDGGTFLLLAGAPKRAASGPKSVTMRREVTIVIDRSGSMRGGKLDQVREAALQILAGLADGERFNIISYNAIVDPFSPLPVEKNAAAIAAAETYLNGLRPEGGTNLHDALVEALRQQPSKGFLPLVLFLTDGLPTIGERSEVAIRNIAVKANPQKRRVFTIGVGLDVNTPLLDRIATSTRAKATFILPEEDVEVKVGQVFRRLKGPVLTSPSLLAMGGGTPRISAIYPRTLDDLFDGDQLVVLGRYRGDRPITFELKGNFFGAPKTFRFEFDLKRATTRNAFVPRLWASRKIAFLIDQIRDAGADRPLGENPEEVAKDPRFKELVDEIVRLSLKYGILTEYTAFLAEEGGTGDALIANAAAADNFRVRAFGDRSGKAGVNQELNFGSQRGQTFANGRNRFLNARMECVEIRFVQQTGDRAFFHRNAAGLPGIARDAWVDSRLIPDQRELEASKTIARGSPAYMALAYRLAAAGRQGCLALDGNILLLVEGEVILIEANEKAGAPK